MEGWTQQQTVTGHFPQGDTYWRCDSLTCGAQIRVREGDDRRKQHDREFHLLRAERGGPNDGYTLHLDGEEIGLAYDKIEHYNLRRAYVTHTWVAIINRGPKYVSPVRGFRRSMDYFASSIEGAKAWGQGKNPKTWHYPETRA